MLPENLKTKFVRSAPVDDDPMSPTSQLFDISNFLSILRLTPKLIDCAKTKFVINRGKC